MLKLFTNRKDFDHFRNQIKTNSVGLVPTMGNLHEGHLSLLEKSIQENDVSILTIYVNPKQFGPNEDFDKYPRTLDQDLSKINGLLITLGTKKEVAVFAPAFDEEIYPKGFKANISITGFNQILEGKIRPTHFDGVSTVVYRLFKITKPARAYFGQKDFQQVLIISKMNRDLELGIDLRTLPIIRSAEGLALSSRNQYLSAQERIDALIISKTLRKIEEMILNNQNASDFVKETLKDSRWDYLVLLDAETLDEMTSTSTQIAILAAIRIGQTRLIDNIVVNKK